MSDEAKNGSPESADGQAEASTGTGGDFADLARGRSGKAEDYSNRQAAIEGRLQEAVAEVKSSYRGKGKALYALPWTLTVSPDGSATDLLASGLSANNPQPPKRDRIVPEGTWYWWHLETTIAIEVTHDVFQDLVSGEGDGSNLLDQMIAQLLKGRPRRPLDQLAVVVSAASLQGDRRHIHDIGKAFRALVDRLYGTLGWLVPVNIVVSGIDTLAGHEAFFKSMPDAARTQAIGARFEVDPAPTDLVGAFDREFRDVVDRLRQVRTGLLARKDGILDPEGIFSFPEAIASLDEGLGILGDVVLQKTNWRHLPMLRGLYFVAPGSSYPHTSDLFTKFLAADGWLAKAE